MVSYNFRKNAAPVATSAPIYLPPATSLPLATLAPIFNTPIVMPTTTLPSTNAFYDDFSNPKSGWLVQASDNTESSYNSSGFYEMDVKKPDYYLVATSPDNLSRPLKNVIIQVRVQPSQTNTGDYGVVCRYQDIDNFYMAGIAGNQFYIGKQVKGQWTYLTDPHKQNLPDRTTDADGYKTIGLSCIDSFFVMEINGIGAAHVSDSEFSSGDPGLVIWGASSAGSSGLFGQAAFDDFKLALP